MELSKEVGHYRARAELWWADYQHRRQARRERLATQAGLRREAFEEQQRKIAAGEVSMVPGWYIHPNDPPGYGRWWDGARWTEHTQITPRAAKRQAQRQSRGLSIAGLVMFIVGLVFWPFFLVSFVIGIVLCTQSRAGDGVLLMVLSVIGPIISLAGCAAILTGGGS